ncbi:enoyl-CoA hydratase/isomerase family protein [Nocardioides daejeonensis]|uniref:enoyl-CoA hydratase/isomerase family protein n=1 Tax=Nocardioides daejeonensis TaxID=1046556 RepID=UPI000D74507D|nr:enoyl-CoA hydratase-related protein [Nocardioides daejeonensis]
MGAEPVLLVERARGLARVTLNRAAHGNALDTALKDALVAELTAIAADDGVRAVLLSGAGPVFCVGQDLGELAGTLRDAPERASETVELHFSPITRLLATMPKPVVAAVHGTCVGAGLGFALACDLQVWGSGVTLGTAFSKVGLTCDSGVSLTLPALVGPARARELLLLARSFTPDEAVGWGFAGPVVPQEEVTAVALALAEQLATGPTLAYASTKRLLGLASAGLPLDDVLAAEGVEQARCGRSADHAHAVESFLAKREPVFSGR